MKYIEQYNSIRAFKADLNSPECICAAQVLTPVGEVMGYQQNGEFVFTVSGTVISEDSLRTIDLSSFNEDQISSGAVQTFINTCNEGDKMIFSSGASLSYMDSLYIIDRAHWTGNELIIGVKEDDLYEYVQVWYTDGTTAFFEPEYDEELEEEERLNDIVKRIYREEDGGDVVKMTIGNAFSDVMLLFNETEYRKLRYIVFPETWRQFVFECFNNARKIGDV